MPTLRSYPTPRRNHPHRRTTVAAIVAVVLLALTVPLRAHEAEALPAPATTLDPAPAREGRLSWPNSFIAAQASDAAYLDDATDRQEHLAKWGMVESAFVDAAQSTQVLFAEDVNHSFLIVAVRGTQELRDALVDARVGRTEPDWQSGVLVHRGFLDSANGVYQRIRDRVRAAKAAGKQVIMAGHSLGGAVAQLTTFRLDKDGVPVHSVITFGAPITGNAAWASTYNKRLIDKTQRFHNRDDLMPCLPVNGDRWVALGASHYELRNGTADRTPDNCARFPLLQTLDPTRLSDRINKLCDRIPRRLRRFLGVIAPNPCANFVRTAVDGALDTLTAILTGSVEDHRIANYIDSMRAAMPQSVKDSPLMRRPAQFNALLAGGSVGDVTSARTGPDGWTSTASWNVGPLTYQALLSKRTGTLRVIELDAGGSFLRQVSQRSISAGAMIIGAYRAAGRRTDTTTFSYGSYVLISGGSYLETYPIQSDNSLGTRATRFDEEARCKAVYDNEFQYFAQCTSPELYQGDSQYAFLYEPAFFYSTATVVSEQTAITEPPRHSVLIYDEETGVYHVRPLDSAGRIGTNTATGTLARGYTAIHSYRSGGASFVIFVNKASGASEVRATDGRANPDRQVQTLQLVTGITSVTSYAAGGNGFIVFHRMLQGTTQVWVLGGNSALGDQVWSEQLDAGWTTVQTIDTATGPLLFRMKE